MSKFVGLDFVENVFYFCFGFIGNDVRIMCIIVVFSCVWDVILYVV